MNVSSRYAPEGSVNQIAEGQGRTANAVYKALNRIRNGLLKCIQRRELVVGGWAQADLLFFVDFIN